MCENRNNLLRRRNVVENLIGKPPFRYEKSDPNSSQSGSVDSEEIEKVINISLSRNRQDLQDTPSSKIQIPNQPCQTTINLYINDPHMVQKNWEKYRKTPPRRKMRNEIVFGKNIPDHTLMKNLLGDLGVKKYSSAPNMTNNKCLSNRRILPSDRYSCEKALTNSKKVFPNLQTCGSSGIMNYPEKKTTFLYVNEGRSGGDFKTKNIEKINEEGEVEEAIKEETNNCPVHYRDHSVVKVLRDSKVMEEEKPQINLKDPLKRFKRKPFGISQLTKNPAILYRDIMATESPQYDKHEQPRRKVPSFNVRTQMVRDILNTNPELMHSYQSGLMRNHKKLFETLRHKNFQLITNEANALQRIETLPTLRTVEKNYQLNDKLSKPVLGGKKTRPICSVESHGTYEEYKRNLVKGSDGTLCCKNEDYRDDDLWSRAETRNIITTEFVRDKIKKFDKLFSKEVGQSSGLIEVHNEDEMRRKKESYSKRRCEIANYSYQNILSHNLLNEENVSFPKETKHAMTRMLSRRSQMSLENRHSNENGKKFGSLREIRNLPIQNRSSAHSSTSCEDGIKSSEINNRCWPGGAERVRSTAEGNTT